MIGHALFLWSNSLWSNFDICLNKLLICCLLIVSRKLSLGIGRISDIEYGHAECVLYTH